MSIDDLLKNAKIVELTPTAEHMKAVVQKRLDFVDFRLGREPGSTMRVTDAAYEAMAEVTKGNVGFALQVMKMVISSEPETKNPPYIVTEDHIRRLGITYEGLCENWDNPLRDAVVLNVKPWYER